MQRLQIAFKFFQTSEWILFPVVITKSTALDFWKFVKLNFYDFEIFNACGKKS